MLKSITQDDLEDSDIVLPAEGGHITVEAFLRYLDDDDSFFKDFDAKTILYDVKEDKFVDRDTVVKMIEVMVNLVNNGIRDHQGIDEIVENYSCDTYSVVQCGELYYDACLINFN